MGQIVYRTGSLVEAIEPYIAHGCNALGSMGAGVAVAIKNTFPEAYAAYRTEFERRGNCLPLGLMIPALSGGKTILNLITQQRFGGRKVHADYGAIRTAMAAVDAYVAEGDGVAMPLIGAGLARGRWSTISAIIEEESRRFRPVVYLLDGVVPTD